MPTALEFLQEAPTEESVSARDFLGIPKPKDDFQTDFTPPPAVQRPPGEQPSTPATGIPSLPGMATALEGGVEKGLTWTANELIKAKNLLTRGEQQAFPPTPPLVPGQSLVPKSISQPLRELAPRALDAITFSGKSDPAIIEQRMHRLGMEDTPENRDIARQGIPNTPAATGISQAAGNVAKGFTSLSGLATLPLFEYKAGRSAILALQAIHTPEEIKKAYDVLTDDKATPEQKWDAGGEAFANLAMTGALALHMGVSEFKRTHTPEQAAVQFGGGKADERKPVPPVLEQAKAAGLNLAANEAAKTLEQKGGEQNASENKKAAEVHANVPAQPGQGQVEVSEQGGGKGVQPPVKEPQAQPEVVLKPTVTDDVPRDSDEHVADFQKFNDLKKQFSALVRGGKMNDAIANIQPEMERIKNRYGGNPPPEPKPAKEVIPGEEEKEKKEGDVLNPPVVPMEGGEAVPMGAAGAGEVPTTGQKPGGTHGVSHETLEQRRLRGEIAPVERGEGIAAEASVERGRQLLQAGSDPEAILSNFEKTGRFSADDLAVARAHGERLAQASKQADAQFGPNSPQAEAAWEADSAWAKRVKKMSTEWHKAGMAQQGETDIDTGTFHGLRRAHEDATGKDFTPKQRKKAQEVAGGVKKAQDSADAAQQELGTAIRRKTGNTDAEKDALAAVARQHRENAIRLAEAEKKRELAKTDEQRAKAKIEEDAAKKALAASKKTVDAAAERLRKAQVEAEAKVKVNHQREEERKAADAALEAANKQRRDAAVKLAEAEKKRQIAKSDAEKKAAEAERKAAQKLVDLTTKRRRDAAVKAAQLAAKHAANPEIPVWNKVREYLDKGEQDFETIRNNVAKDLGMSPKEVTKILGKDPTTKRLADDAWRKQQEVRRVKQQAKLWLLAQAQPWILKLPLAVLREAFNLKVIGHVAVGLGTHAPAVLFQPKYWGEYFRNYGNMWRMGLPTEQAKATHEMMMQDLQRRPNWTVARGVGLENDPFQANEYQLTGLVERLLPNLVRGGNRAYDALKLLRQDMFDKQWNVLPKTMQTREMAAGLADSINHVTGIVKKSPFGKASNVLFAPRLLASRFAWAFGDPARAAITGAKTLTDIVKGERETTPEEKAFAINQVREKATVVATMGAMLAANAAILAMSGSKQKINFTDPTRSDWLKFKAAGLDISFGNAMLTTLRLPVREAAILLNNTVWAHGKKGFEGADRGTYEAIGEYFRNQLNPAVGDIADVAFQSDAQGRPLPWSRQKVPAYLQRQGVNKAYTWGEWVRDATMPIALGESVKQVFNDYGVPKDQADKWEKVLATAIFMGGTGGRISEDTQTATKTGLGQVIQDVKKWKEKKGYDNPEPVVPVRANDDLMAGLKTDNAADARKALDQIVAGKTPAEVRKIAAYYRRTLNQAEYLTGSRAHEQEYVKGLDASGKTAYDEAKAERRAMWQKFIKAWRSKFPAPQQ